MTRNSFDELPKKGEIRAILEYEAQRPIPESKKNTHYGDYSTVINLLKHVGVDTSLFDKTIADFGSINEFLDEAALLLDDTIIKILLDGVDVEYYNNVYDYLSEEDGLQDISADLIFVFGTKTTLRIKKAIELYKNGLAKQIMISGRGPFYKNDIVRAEAKILKEFAITNGISEAVLIIEAESITMPDNIKRSLKLLEDKNIKHTNIIIVNSPFSQRRGWVHFNKYSEGIKFVRINSEVSDTFSKESWYKSETGIRIILNEFIRIKGAELLNTA